MLGRQWRAHVPRDVYDRRAGLLTSLSVDFVRLPTSSGRVAQGGVIDAPGGARFVVVSVHLDAFDPRRRLRQAEELVAGIGRLGIPNFVMAGDFNFDASVAAHGSQDQRLYRYLTGEMVDAGRHAGVTSIISRRLDYIFFRSARVDTANARVLRDRRINIMDHDPLLVELALSGNPASIAK